MAGSSPFVLTVEPITATDDEIRAALAEAELPPLLPALAYATGDLSLLKPELKTDPLMASMPQAGLSEEQQAEIRELALQAIVAFRDAGSRPVPPPGDEVLLQILEYAVGGADMASYLPLLEEEFAYKGEDRRGPSWTKAELAPDRPFSVLIIGAGMSGILAAHRLEQAGVEFTIIEKNSDVGGTWLENSYPGCRVDNPNHNFSYSFAQRHDWPFHFSTQPVLHDYFSRCADAFGIRDRIRFQTSVASATWSDSDKRWTVVVQPADGPSETLTADVVISAVGQLNRPSMPTIEGVGSFEGPAFHSARWDHGVDLTGKRVAVIGTGASAVQFIPEIAPQCGELVVFQRTPPWMGPTPEYHDPVPAGQTWLYKHLPSYSELNRFWIFWRMGDGALEAVRVDEAWPDKTASVSMMNEMARLLLSEYIKAEFADRPELIDKVLPTYPVGAKRMLRDNGVWARAIKRDNVELVTEPIAAITPKGVTTVDGEERQFDVIIYGTGFQASKFLTPMQVHGAGGVDLHQKWAGDARAYLGITSPGFPNLFMLYGPNTNIVVNGSIIYFSECGVRYIVDCIRLLLEGGHAGLSVREDVHDAFNEAVDAGNRLMAWGCSDVSSWYKNEHGHVAQNWPFTLLEYWQRTLAADPAHFEFV